MSSSGCAALTFATIWQRVADSARHSMERTRCAECDQALSRRNRDLTSMRADRIAFHLDAHLDSGIPPDMIDERWPEARDAGAAGMANTRIDQTIRFGCE